MFLAGVLALGAVIAARAADGRPADEGAEAATHREVAPLDVKFQTLAAMRLHTSGNLLAADSGAEAILVIDPKGKVIDTLKPGFGPEALDVAADGVLYCGGQGRLAKLDIRGKLLKTVRLPEPEKPAANAPPRRGTRPDRVSGIAVTDKDLFVAYGAGWSLRSRSRLFRFDRDLENLRQIAEDLRGCCQRCDIVARNGVVYVAENAAHRVVAFDRDGKILNTWGERGRKGLEGFGACCNPMNLCFDAAGVLYTAESGLGRVKRHATDGKFLDLVGYVDVQCFEAAGGLAASCSNIAIAVTADGARVYVMDYKQNRIRVLEKKP
jgi:DNA-binding beta-propeller fold protein YncE